MVIFIRIPFLITFSAVCEALRHHILGIKLPAHKDLLRLFLGYGPVSKKCGKKLWQRPAERPLYKVISLHCLALIL